MTSKRGVQPSWAPGMGRNLYQKIIGAHLGSGEMKPGAEIGLIIDSTLTQDSLGVMAYLQYEAIGIPAVRTKLSVAYVDHQTLQDGFENADDHRYLETVTDKYGVLYSRAGNGICHQVHLECSPTNPARRQDSVASVMCLSPVTFLAQTHLTSELLRFL